jgi:hypothetical protein
MTRKVGLTDKPARTVSIRRPRVRRIASVRVRAALSAEPFAAGPRHDDSALSLFALRSEIAKRLQSRGGRPALAGAEKRAKVPMARAQWRALERLAEKISESGFKPSAGQVASALLQVAMGRLRGSAAAAVKTVLKGQQRLRAR